MADYPCLGHSSLYGQRGDAPLLYQPLLKTSPHADSRPIQHGVTITAHHAFCATLAANPSAKEVGVQGDIEIRMSHAEWEIASLKEGHKNQDERIDAIII